MSTIYYMIFTDKQIVNKLFDYSDYELIDTPCWGYLIKIGKCSCGWEPVFESHKSYNSVKGLLEIIDKYKPIIINEYNETISKTDLINKLINWNRDNKDVLKHVDKIFYNDDEGYCFFKGNM